MRLHATIASVLMLLLVLMTGAASACAIACEMQGASHCHGSTAPAPMAAMQHCETAQPSHAVAASVANSAHCLHQVCAEQPSILGERGGAIIAHLQPATVVSASIFLPFPMQGRDSAQYASPPAHPTPLVLHTLLRV